MRHRRPALIAGLVLLLAGCAPSAPPPPAGEGTNIPSIEGDWVLVRGVSETDDGSGLEIGDRETRNLIISSAECDARSCTGTVVSSDPEGSGSTEAMPYHWDGTAFGYDAEPAVFGCVDNHGASLLEDAYRATFTTDFTAVDEAATAFEGTMASEVEPLDDEAAAALADLGCPLGGRTEYKVRIDRAES